MTVECFLDTNIFLYSASRNPASLEKKRIANEIIAGKGFGLSAQVLQEFYSVATRKAEFKLTEAKALEWVEHLDEFPCVVIDSALVKVAAKISAHHRISYYDGAIVAAAQALGAPILYTEDLNHGQSFGAVMVVDPFRGTNAGLGFHEG